jgi:hypothetical protein
LLSNVDHGRPRLRSLSPIPLGIDHLGLTLIVPTVVDPNLPQFAVPAAYGDLIAAGLALLSLGALRTGWRYAPVVVWIFTVEGGRPS